MFVSQHSLPQLLPPSEYWSLEQHEREATALWADAWHLVGTTAELARPGDFLTCDLSGQPVQVRNMAGDVVAVSNVCAHRHCLLSSQSVGRSDRLACQYHGWEYGADGFTRRIPEPKNFVPFDREQFRLPRYRVETCGQLVFVNLSASAPSLQDFLGDFFDLIAVRFGEDWRLALNWSPSYSVNWKVVVENSLEAYHVPNVHPRTFKSDPGEGRSEHLMLERRTALRTPLPFCPHSRLDDWLQRRENGVARWLGALVTATYEQHHVFPNLLFSFTDAISLCHAVTPTGPAASRAVVRQFGLSPRGANAPRRFLAWGWGGLKAAVTRRVMKEDMHLLPAIQAGLATSEHPGVLGRCEERLHAFQSYVVQAVSQERDLASDARSASSGNACNERTADCHPVTASGG